MGYIYIYIPKEPIMIVMFECVWNGVYLQNGYVHEANGW